MFAAVRCIPNETGDLHGLAQAIHTAICQYPEETPQLYAPSNAESAEGCVLVVRGGPIGFVLNQTRMRQVALLWHGAQRTPQAVEDLIADLLPAGTAAATSDLDVLECV